MKKDFLKKWKAAAHYVAVVGMLAAAGGAEAARGLMPQNVGQGPQVGNIAQNVGNNAAKTGDVTADILYAIGSLALLYAGYVAYMYSKHKGKDQGNNTLPKAAMAILAGAICLYMPTALNIGVSSAVNNSGPIQGIK